MCVLEREGSTILWPSTSFMFPLDLSTYIILHTPIPLCTVFLHFICWSNFKTIFHLLQILPRFQPENLEHNKNLFERVKNLATIKGCTPSQLSLAWVHHQGNDVCPIPGTTKITNLNQNIGALAVKLTPEDMAELESIASAGVVKGDLNRPDYLTWKDSNTPPLSSWKPTWSSRILCSPNNMSLIKHVACCFRWFDV